jgi:serine/threonine protein kinase
VVEFLPGGTLLSGLEEGRLSWEHTVGVALDVANALRFLHCQTPPIFHRNITAANVFFPDPQLSSYPRPARLNAVRLSASVTPHLCKEIPETRAGTGAHTEKSDIYCFGHLLWIMVFPSGMVDPLNPWAAFDAEHLPADTPSSLAALIQACVDQNPSRRYAHEECSRHQPCRRSVHLASCFPSLRRSIAHPLAHLLSA